jgi:serine/threonine-protein kinase
MALLIAAGLGAMIVIGSAAFFARNRGSGAAGPTERVSSAGLESRPSAVTIAAPPASTSAAVAKVRVTLEAQPAGAQITLDGKMVTNPHSLDVDRDGSKHAVRATAPGYLAEERSVDFDRDQAIVLALTRATAGATTATDAVDLSTQRTKRVKRTVDDKDPYQ